MSDLYFGVGKVYRKPDHLGICLAFWPDVGTEWGEQNGQIGITIGKYMIHARFPCYLIHKAPLQPFEFANMCDKEIEDGGRGFASLPVGSATQTIVR